MSPDRAARVLVVEDDAYIGGLLYALLNDLGHKPRVVASMAAARAAAAEDKPELVLLDLRLPDGDGLELCAELCRDGDDGPAVVVVTAGRGRVAEALALGARDFVPKPFDLVEVEARVAAALRDQRHHRELAAARAKAEGDERRLAFLAQATMILTSSLDPEVAMQGLAELIVPALAGACMVDLLEDDGWIHRIAVASADLGRRDLLRDEHRYPPDAWQVIGTAQVLRSGQPVIHPPPANRKASGWLDEPAVGLADPPGHAVMLVPLRARERVIGVISFIADSSGRTYGADDLKLALDLAGRAALAIENAQLFRRAQSEVAERRRAEEALRVLLEQASDGIFVTDVEGRFLSVNPAACELLGYTRDELLAMRAPDIMSPDDRVGVGGRLHKMLVGQTLVSERDLLRRDGTMVPVEISSKKLDDGRIQAFVRDVTRRKRGQAEKERLLAQLARLEERERIALDLHDGAIQSLYAVMLGLGAAERALRGHDEAAHEAMAEAIPRIEGVIRDIRDYVEGLRDCGCAGGGLAAELGALAAQAGGADGLRVSVAVSARVEQLVPSSTRSHLLRIAQEAVSNVVRHAGARSAAIRLGRSRGRLLLTVRDDGRGFDPAAPTSRGMGLGNMAERARLIGGRLVVRSRPGGGTRVRVELPLPSSG